MTERNDMPTPVPMWLRELAVKHVERTTDPAYLSWSKGDWTYAVCELLWERGEREPVDPDRLIAEEMARKISYTTPFSAAVLAGIKRGRELAEAKP